MDPRGLLHRPMPATRVEAVQAAAVQQAQQLIRSGGRVVESGNDRSGSRGSNGGGEDGVDGSGNGVGGGADSALLQPLDFEAEDRNLAETLAIQRYRELADDFNPSHQQPLQQLPQQAELQPHGQQQQAAASSRADAAAGAALQGGPLAPQIQNASFLLESAAALAAERQQEEEMKQKEREQQTQQKQQEAAVAAVQEQAAAAQERAEAAELEMRVLRQRAWAADYIIGLDGQPQRATWPKSLADIPAGATLWVTFASGGYGDLMLNWVAHVRHLAVPHLVAPLDAEARRLCAVHGVPYLADAELDVGQDGTKDEGFRGNFTAFRRLGAAKPALVERLLRRRRLGAVVLSDTDTVWLRHIDPLLTAHPAADIFVSTDCASHEAEAHAGAGGVAPQPVTRCGHLPGATGGRAFNTGVLIFRNTAPALQLLAAWRLYLTDPSRKTVTIGGREGWQVTDQLAFNLLLGLRIAPIHPTLEDPGVIWAYNDALRLAPLPVLAAANGHTYFQQRLHERHNAAPYVVHTTFTWGGSEVKAARLREAGLWALDPASYFSCCQPQPAGTNRALGQPPGSSRHDGQADAGGGGSPGGVQSDTGRAAADGGGSSGAIGSTTGTGSGGSGSASDDGGGGGGGGGSGNLAAIAVASLSGTHFAAQPHTGAGGFLTYDNTVDAAVSAAAEGHLRRKGRKMADLHLHLVAAAFQLAAFRDAWAVARVLDRTLVLPRMRCWCDSDWYASVLERCVMDGADTQLPFDCPADSFLDPRALQGGLPHRMAGFLEDARLSPAVRHSSVVVTVLEPGAGVQGGKGWAPAGLSLQAGASATELASRLAAGAGAAVLRLQGFRPGAFGGFGSQGANAAFDAQAGAVLDSAASSWCCRQDPVAVTGFELLLTSVACACSGEQPVDPKLITWPFAQPPPLAGTTIGAASVDSTTDATAAAPFWEPPHLQRPAFCDHLDEQNAAFLAHDNHPCTFLSWGDVDEVILSPEAEPQQPQNSKDGHAEKETDGRDPSTATDSIEQSGADVVHELGGIADGGLHWLWGR